MGKEGTGNGNGKGDGSSPPPPPAVALAFFGGFGPCFVATLMAIEDSVRSAIAFKEGRMLEGAAGAAEAGGYLLRVFMACMR